MAAIFFYSVQGVGGVAVGGGGIGGGGAPYKKMGVKKKYSVQGVGGVVWGGGPIKKMG